MRRPRCLLVHANPFQRVLPVSPYGLERLRTAAAAAETSWEIELLDPFLVSDEPVALAEETARRFQPDLVGLGVRVVDDCIVVARPGDPGPDGVPDDEPFDVAWFGPEILELRQALGRAAPAAQFVLGGATFSAFPAECLDYFDVDLGIVSAAEDAFPALLAGLAADGPLDGIPGLVRRGAQASHGVYAHGNPNGRPTQRDPLYTPLASFPIRTRIGCAGACAYCLTANLGRTHSETALESVFAEIEATVAHSRAHGLGRAPLFFADDELNLQSEQHALLLLHGLAERRLAEKVKWRAYFNPTPLSDELARIIAATNGHVSVTVDTAAEQVMARVRKPFRRSHLDEMIPRLVEHGVSCDVGLMFGLPGEDRETIAETVAWARSLPSSIRVSYSVGARVYPHTPLAAIAREEPHYVVGADDPSFFAPVVYSSPVPPRRLAELVGAEFADLPNVRPVGVSYRFASQIDARAYRVMLDGRDPEVWAAVLAAAEEEEGDDGRRPAERLLECLHIALWHRRFDLAAPAARLLSRAGLELPDGASRRRFQGVWALCRVLSEDERMRRAARRGYAAATGRTSSSGA